MNTDYPYTLTDESVTVIIDGETYTVKAGDSNFEAARKAVLSKQWSTIPNLLSKGWALADWAKGLFTFRDGRMYYRGDALPDELHDRMILMAQRGENPTFIMKFWENLQANPSWRSVQQLWSFLKNEGIPIDEEGYILAYKSVRSDYMDKYTNTVSNHVGAVIEMPRNKISDDPNQLCHFGYHAGAIKYARDCYHSAGDRIIVVRINPRDVVCIPNDHSWQKMRVSKYTVIGNFGDVLPDTVYNLRDDPAAKPVDSKSPSGKTAAPSHVEKEATLDLPVTAQIVNGWADRKRPTPEEIAELDEAPLNEVDLIPIDALRRVATELGISGSGKYRKSDLVPMVAKALEDRRTPLPEGDIPREGRLTDSHLETVHKMSNEEIRDLPVSVLRQYASRKLFIIGASKLRKFEIGGNGKEAGLVSRILDVRRGL